MTKPNQTEEQEQVKPGDQIAVPRRQMVDEIVGVIGAKSTLILWDLLINIRREDDMDSQIFRRLKEEYLNAGDENACVGLIIGVLKEWERERGTSEIQLAKFLNGMREVVALRFAERCAEMLHGYNEPARAKILDAVKVLRELFAGTLVKVNLKDMPVN